MKDPWYKDGLNFTCTQCGKCCSGFPGYVWLDDEEIDNISNLLKISKEEFLKKYTRSINGRISLKENLPNYDCIFFKEKKCTIYEKRPKQCKSYPFWKENLRSKKSWDDVKKDCEGINDPSNKFTLEEIEKKLF